MEFRPELKELNPTAEEIDRLSRAFKDETFREMLRDYARELSDPENKKRYEEEIKIMERENGNTVEFIHPEPFRALRTSVNGERTCFINICSNEKVGKPVCKQGVTAEGRGQCWSLPHNLHPGRLERDPKGREVTIYDVIFHPDTLQAASKSEAFMDAVESAAFDGVRDAFGVSLDKNNATEAKAKYKGTPQPCVVRRPIPGHGSKERPGSRDPLAFPYPGGGGRPAASSHADAAESPVTKEGSDAEPRGPTEPSYAVKYRSFVDLQDFRCSRDSARSPRPKEIVVTIDLPLLEGARDASLEVEERRLLLESKTPAYRLELPLAYPVDGDGGEAKFSKARGRLTVTLPVLPSDEGYDSAVGLAKANTGGDERQEEENREVEEEEDAWKGEERGGLRGVEQRGDDEEEKVKDGGVVEGEQTEKGPESVREGKVREQRREGANFATQRRQHREDIGGRRHDGPEDGQNGAAEEKESSVTGGRCDSVAHAEENSCNEITAELPGDVNLIGLESNPETRTSNVKEETEQTEETLEHLKVVKGAAALLHDMSSRVPETDEAKGSGGGGSDGGVPRPSEELATGSAEREEEGSADGDDLATAQPFQGPGHTGEPPPAMREIDEHGNERAIRDHSTSAGFVFQNCLMFELD